MLFKLTNTLSEKHSWSLCCVSNVAWIGIVNVLLAATAAHFITVFESLYYDLNHVTDESKYKA